MVVVAGAGIGSVSWNCSPRTGDATPASAGAGEITVVTGTTVVVVTGVVVVVTSDVVDVDVDVDVAGVLGRGAGSGNDGSPAGGWRARVDDSDVDRLGLRRQRSMVDLADHERDDHDRDDAAHDPRTPC